LNAAIRALQECDLDAEKELGPLALSLPSYGNPSYRGQYALFGRW